MCKDFVLFQYCSYLDSRAQFDSFYMFPSTQKYVWPMTIDHVSYIRKNAWPVATKCSKSRVDTIKITSTGVTYQWSKKTPCIMYVLWTFWYPHGFQISRVARWPGLPETPLPCPWDHNLCTVTPPVGLAQLMVSGGWRCGGDTHWLHTGYTLATH